MEDLTRRGFLGAAAGAVCVSAGVVGLASAQEAAAGGQGAQAADGAANGAADADSASSSASGSASGAVEKTYGAMLNPQADEAELDAGGEADYSALFTPLTIGGHTMKNRIMKSAAGSETQHSTDWPSDTSLRYYEQFAKGGVGAICFESSNVFPSSGDASAAIPGAEGAEAPAGMVSLDISTDDGIAAHKAIADDMHQYGTVVIGQLYDMMMSTGASSSFAPSSTLETSFSNGHMQTTEEVQTEIGLFVDAIERYYKAGFDGVELNASCNHYFSTYLSRYVNRERTDQYSGETLENRARVLTEIISGARERIGTDDFIIQVLYSGIEGSVDELGADEGFTTVEEACELAKLFEAAGASCLHIRSEAYGHHCAGFMPDVEHLHEHGETGYGTTIDYARHFGGNLHGDTDGYGALIDVAARIKQCVSIPVGCVGAMDARMAPEVVNGAIRDGKIDYILATRSLMADPELPNKLAEGRRDECAPCTHCMTCFVAPFDFGTPMYCRVNPSITRAYTDEMPEGYDPLPAAEPLKVAVIGGGVAGMEAARVCAMRGHSVKLYERRDRLGGDMALVASIKGPHEKIMAHEQWLENQLDLYGVEVALNSEVTSDDVAGLGADAFIVATGCAAADAADDADAADVLADAATLDDLRAAEQAGSSFEFGEDVAIVGAKFRACELAISLLKQGKRVTLLNEGTQDDLFMGAATWPRLMGKRWMEAHGLVAYHGCKIVAAGEETVTVETSYGVTVDVLCDTLVNLEPCQPQRELFEAASGVCALTFAVGDCYSPGTMANATARANVVARNVEVAPATTDTSDMRGEVFSATASGIGDVTVWISVENGAIVEARVDTSNETAGIGRDLGDGFAEQIAATGAVEAVSGASVTSAAVQAALADCLEQAGLA